MGLKDFFNKLTGKAKVLADQAEDYAEKVADKAEDLADKLADKAEEAYETAKVKGKELADKVVNWTITNMQDSEGYFYYQLKQFFSSHIPYMRWSNAFMFNAMSHYLLAE